MLSISIAEMCRPLSLSLVHEICWEAGAGNDYWVVFCKKMCSFFMVFPRLRIVTSWAVDAFEEDPTLLFLSIEASILKIS
jgi:hypothetical protein